MEKLVAAEPRDTLWQRDLSHLHNKEGDVKRAQGDLSGALKSHRAGMGIMQKLVAKYPTEASWKQILLVSYLKLGALDLPENPVSERRQYVQLAQDILGKMEELGGLTPQQQGLREELLQVQRGL